MWNPVREFNQFVEATKTKIVRMFTGDCLMYHDVHSMEDTKRLQNDLNSVQAWEHD